MGEIISKINWYIHVIYAPFRFTAEDKGHCLRSQKLPRLTMSGVINMIICT